MALSASCQVEIEKVGGNRSMAIAGEQSYVSLAAKKASVKFPTEIIGSLLLMSVAERKPLASGFHGGSRDTGL